MDYFIIIFWVFILLLIYAYIGYGMLAWMISFLQNIFKTPTIISLQTPLPTVAIVIPAFNEAQILESKIINTLELDYPSSQIKIIIITDGSNDASFEILNKYPIIVHLHQSERKGKMAALNRAMTFVDTPIVVFSDANTLLNKNAIREIVHHYADKKVGGVAGEKKVVLPPSKNIIGLGEGMYWQYESAMKQLDSDLYTVVAAAGELFSIRSQLFTPLPEDTILDDLMLAISICKKGYTIRYEKNAYAIEAPSINLFEERKRKIRIACGAAQAVARIGMIPSTTNWMLNFQFLSRRVIRWIISPIALPIVLILNLIIVMHINNAAIYQCLLLLQIIFYTMAAMGWLLYKLGKKSILFFAPFYFVFMNSCMLTGFIKQIFRPQHINWEKAKRATIFATQQND